MSSVTFAQAKDAHLAWVDGQIHLASSSHRAVADKQTEEEGSDQRDIEADVIPELDALPLNQVGMWCSSSTDVLACFCRETVEMSFNLDLFSYKHVRVYNVCTHAHVQGYTCIQQMLSLQSLTTYKGQRTWDSVRQSPKAV